MSLANSVSSGLSKEKEAELAAFIASFYTDPYGFVMAVYPWGQPTLPDGSPNPLHDKDGPDVWQREELMALGEHIKNNLILSSLGLDTLPWKSAYGTGHGVGKTAFHAWIVQFFMSTRPDTRGVTTASTQFQLEDKTWPELAKWHNLLLNRHWFRWSATAYTFAAYPEEKQKNYRIAAATVSEHNTEAFAGLHNEGKTVLIVFDEASGVAGKVWEVAEGATTDGEVYFFALGNLTKPDGEFADCFDKHSHIYRTRNIDSRDVKHTNKAALNAIIEKYGIDDDIVKVRIRGMPPSQSYNGFISPGAVNDAMQNRPEIRIDLGAALIMAVDVAHEGGDESVIGFRQGWDARSIPMIALRGLNTVKLADQIAKIYDAKRPDALIIESVGGGIGVCDILKDRGYKVHRAYPGAPLEKDYVNNRALWWSLLRDWIYEHGVMQEDKELYSQLTKIQYTISRHNGKTLIESKADMKKRGLPSPDRADMLMLTFAVRVARRDRRNDLDAARLRRLAKMEDNPAAL